MAELSFSPRIQLNMKLLVGLSIAATIYVVASESEERFGDDVKMALNSGKPLAEAYEEADTKETLKTEIAECQEKLSGAHGISKREIQIDETDDEDLDIDELEEQLLICDDKLAAHMIHKRANMLDFDSNDGRKWNVSRIFVDTTDMRSDVQQQAIACAIKQYETTVDFHFTQGQTCGPKAKNCLRFVNKESAPNTCGGHTHVGYDYQDEPHQIFLSDCSSVAVLCGITTHEMLHAFGAPHEQSRADRDAKVKVMWENIADDMRNNFEKTPSIKMDWEAIGDYDFHSIMHYRSNTLSKNGHETLMTVDPAQEDVIGNTRTLSLGDIHSIKAAYFSEQNSPASHCIVNGETKLAKGDHVARKTATFTGWFPEGNFFIANGCAVNSAGILASDIVGAVYAGKFYKTDEWFKVTTGIYKSYGLSARFQVTRDSEGRVIQYGLGYRFD